MDLKHKLETEVTPKISSLDEDIRQIIRDIENTAALPVPEIMT
jgi:hypothetical protein